MYIYCFLERGSRAFISFRKEYVISRKAQNYCFQDTCTHLVFRLESTAPWVTHRNRPWRPSEKPKRGFLQGLRGNKGARLGFTSLLVRSFNLAIIPKTSFKKKKKRKEKNYHCHILNPLARIYLVRLQKECYTFHNLIQSWKFLHSSENEMRSVKTAGHLISKRALPPQELRGLDSHKNIYMISSFPQECYYTRPKLDVAQCAQFWKHKWTQTMNSAITGIFSSTDFWFKAWVLESDRPEFEYQGRHLTGKTGGKLFNLINPRFPNL